MTYRPQEIAFDDLERWLDTHPGEKVVLAAHTMTWAQQASEAWLRAMGRTDVKKRRDTILWPNGATLRLVNPDNPFGGLRGERNYCMVPYAPDFAIYAARRCTPTKDES